MIVITHKRTNDQGVILELKDDHNVVYTKEQVRKKLMAGIPIKIQSSEILSAEDLEKGIFNELPDFYYRDQNIRPCQYL